MAASAAAATSSRRSVLARAPCSSDARTRTGSAPPAATGSRARSTSCARISSGRCGSLDVHRLRRSIDPSWIRLQPGITGDAMKLVRFGPSGAERPGLILDDGTRVDASGCTSDYDEAFFDRGGLDTLRAWVT